MFPRKLHAYHKLWKRGAGTQLVQEALACARSKGAEVVYVVTAETNVLARRLYEKCGFKEYERKVRCRRSLKQ